MWRGGPEERGRAALRAVGGSAAPGPTALVEPHPRIAGDAAGACHGPSILKEGGRLSHRRGGSRAHGVQPLADPVARAVGQVDVVRGPRRGRGRGRSRRSRGRPRGGGGLASRDQIPEFQASTPHPSRDAGARHPPSAVMLCARHRVPGSAASCPLPGPRCAPESSGCSVCLCAFRPLSSL